MIGDGGGVGSKLGLGSWRSGLQVGGGWAG
jgi:hypothetical protein